MKKPHHRIVAYILTGSLIGALSIHYINKKFAPGEEFALVKTKIQVQKARGIKPNPVIPPLPTKQSGQSTTVPDMITKNQTELPSTMLLKVPFSPQAPTANWDELHNEACEETSALMAHFFFLGDQRSILPPEEVEKEIAKLTEWEEKHFGYHLDINSEETAQMIAEIYELKVKILTDFTEDDLKHELAEGRLLLFPANGKMLGNPNFRSGGPPYHMLVLRGYDSQGFISNDPGTRKGMNYPYSYDTLYSANGDFDHETHMVDLTKKNVIVVWK